MSNNLAVALNDFGVVRINQATRLKLFGVKRDSSWNIYPRKTALLLSPGVSFLRRDMKFFRMDSDQPDWQVWSTVYDEVGRRDFLLAKAMYFDLYCLIAQEAGPDSAQTTDISIRKLAESLRISRRKAAEMLPKLGRLFAFSTQFVRPNAAQMPTFVQISYPNFLKKQKKYFKSDSDGGGEKDKSNSKNKTRQDKNNTVAKKKSHPSESDRALAKDWLAHASATQPWSSFSEEKFSEEICEMKSKVGLTDEQASALLAYIVQDDFWKDKAISPASLLKKSKNGLRKIDNILTNMKRIYDKDKGIHDWIEGGESFKPFEDETYVG